MDRNTLIVLAAILLGIGMLIYGHLKKKKNMALAENGEDMARLQQAVAQVLPGEAGYQVAYAHYEKVEYYGRSRRTTYYCYALAFDANRLWVIPLGFNKESIRPAAPSVITKDALGAAKVEPRMKDGVLKGFSATLRDKNGENPVFFDVDVMNTQDDRFHHLNIAQQHECDQLYEFMTGIAQTVAAENSDLQVQMDEKAFAQAKKSGMTLGVLGILTCWTGLIGLIFGGMGLLVVPKPSATGGKAIPAYILCLASTILSVAVLVIGILCVVLF